MFTVQISSSTQHITNKAVQTFCSTQLIIYVAYTAYNLRSNSDHGTNTQQYTAYNISSSTHGTNMHKWTAYNIVKCDCKVHTVIIHK